MLSVKTFHDRIRHIESELKRHGIAFEWIFEHDADELTPGQIDAVFAPSDMKRAHQSLVLKHIETWQRCVERGYRRVLVLEDDAVLARDFERVFALAMDEADRVDRPYMVYLGCGDNRYVAGARSSPAMLLTPGIELPATDATVLDRRAAELRLAYVAARKVARPADWLMREADAAMGITQFWLREPVVEQGSMNGRFMSVLDDKRTDRGRGWYWLRFRWDRWRRRTLGSTRAEEVRIDADTVQATVRRDALAISVARVAASMSAIGALIDTGVASAAAGVMVVALLVAPSRWRRLKLAFWQPLGQASLLLFAVLGFATAWSPLDAAAAVRDRIGLAGLPWLFVALALFETRRSKAVVAAAIAGAAALAACLSIGGWLGGVAARAGPAPMPFAIDLHATAPTAFAVGLLGLAAFGWWLVAAVRQPVTGLPRIAGLTLLAAWCLTSLLGPHFGTVDASHLVMILLGVLLAREADLALPAAAAMRPDTPPLAATRGESAGHAAQAPRTDRLH